MKNILEISKGLGIPDDYVECYGKNKAKITEEYYDTIKDRPNAKLILMTSINPTPFGEGKTTQSIGLGMGLNRIGKKAIVVLREPSLGPVLLCAVIDNHIYFGNELNIDVNRIVIKRVLDMNERSLRHIEIKDKKVHYETGFEITVACEIMAICCLATDRDNLREMLGNILVAYTVDGKPVYAKELKVVGAMMALLKDILKPNLVQTVEETPCLVHLGPFANIAHGCNSVVATKLGMKVADYVVTEAGFGSDLGAEKFMDIKCRKAGLKPDLSVVVATVKALKYNGGMPVDELSNESLEYLEKGVANLGKHIENMQKYGVPTMVCINKYTADTDAEVEYPLNLDLKEQKILQEK